MANKLNTLYSQKKKNRVSRIERLFFYITRGVSYVVSLLVIGIMVLLFTQAIPFILEHPLGWISTHWDPTSSHPKYGVLGSLLSTLLVSFIALCVATPIALGASLYIVEFLPKKWIPRFQYIFEVLNSLPSVIFGLIGITLFAPWIAEIFHLSIGLTGFTAALLIGFMLIPTMSLILIQGIQRVPLSWRDTAYSLGSDKKQLIYKLIIPVIKKDLLIALVLCFGRAAGETLVVAMVAGNSIQWPIHLMAPVRTMTATLAMEMGEAVFHSMHYHSLFFIGFLLFIINFTMNSLLHWLLKRGEK